MNVPVKKNTFHTPVLVSELMAVFSKNHPPEKILDCTFGMGGHSLALLKTFSQVHITALDCDDEAVQYGSSLKEVKEGQIKLLKYNFHNFVSSSEPKETYDLVLMDLGVSSPQLDQKDRGFSFYQKGPLDMRMDRELKFKASDIVNSWGKKELVRLFQTYGEIRSPYKVVEAILRRRRKEKFKDTMELSHLIQQHWTRRGRKNHPATPWFLALRMEVNQELEGLSTCLPDFLPLLRGGGCFVVISFHSLEDRIVKKAFRQFVAEGQGTLWNKKVIRPSLEERTQNPRSSSAKMRVFKKATDI